MAQRKPKPKGDEIDRLVAQADARAREAGLEIEPEECSLEWYRQDWPARKREFIENEIKIRDAFDKNKLKPLICYNPGSMMKMRKSSKKQGNI